MRVRHVGDERISPLHTTEGAMVYKWTVEFLTNTCFVVCRRRRSQSSQMLAKHMRACTGAHACVRVCMTRKLCAKILVRTKTDILDEERQKKLDSPDKCMFVRRRLDSEAVPLSLRPAPWGGYCGITANDQDGIDIAHD